MPVHSSVLDLIGNTPVVDVSQKAGIPIEDLPVGTQDRLPTNESGKE